MAKTTVFPTELSPSDQLMWTIERDPVLRSPILAIGLLDREPDWAAVIRTFERAVERIPRLRQRVQRTGLPLPRTSWVDDPEFNLAYHLRRVRAPLPGDLRSVLDLAAPMAAAALDPARPLWECTLIEGLASGRAAFVLKFHHTITDGVGGVDLAGAVFDVTRDGTAPPAPTGPPPAPRDRRRIAAVARVAGAGLYATGHPRDAAATGARLVRSIGRMLQPAPAPLSPVLRGRGLDRRLDVLEYPLADLHRSARRMGGTINDVFLSGLAGGFHDFHQRLGHEVAALRVTMPISVRAEADGPGGNRFVPARFVLPIDDPDPVDRARIAGAIVRGRRDEPANGLSGVLARLLNALPGSVTTALFGSMLKNVDVDAVDVPGLQQPAFVGGAAIERLWAFAPPTGAAVSVTLLSHGDTACVSVLSDRAAVRDTDMFRTCLDSAMDGVLAVGGQPTRHTEFPKAVGQ